MLRLLTAFLSLALFAADYTALDRYVATPDSTYTYNLVRTFPSIGATIYQLEVVSQNWLTTAEVDRTEWRHWVTVARPSRLISNTGLLLINGGANRESAGQPNPLLLIAAQSGAVVINVEQIPNQPLRFAGEERTRSEDALIAYSWKKFIDTGDDRWPALLPMTKAVVRSMDAVSDFLAKLPENPVNINKFIVAGGSKRGWTTWTTAAVDPRVVAIAPLVFDAPNMEQSFLHHFRSYGFWSEAVRDYEQAGIFSWFSRPEVRPSLEIMDPYSYLDRFMMPKYLVHSTGDQFFLPDSSRFYFDALPGEKYLRYIPNTDHGIDAEPETASNVLAWAQALLTNFPRPRFYWKMIREEGKLLVRTIDKPTKALLWQASNPDARDFRLQTIGHAWRSEPITDDNGIYFVTLPAPATGYTAFFIELTYPGPGSFPLVFTTEVVVTPDTYPFPAPPTGEVNEN
jgi:PhoPQ-activated pathogenicity-related protein